MSCLRMLGSLQYVLRGQHTKAAFGTQTGKHPLPWTGLKNRNARLTAGLRAHDISVMNRLACPRPMQKSPHPLGDAGQSFTLETIAHRNGQEEDRLGS